MEDRKEPINVVLHVVSGFHDVGFEQRIDNGVLSCFRVNMMDFRGKNLVFAVLRPRLSQAFQFHIRGSVDGQPLRSACGLGALVAIMISNRLHLREVQRKQPLFRQGHERGVVNFQVNGLWWGEGLRRGCRERQLGPLARSACLLSAHKGPLDEPVVEG